MKLNFFNKTLLLLGFSSLAILFTACPFRCDNYVESHSYLPESAFDNIPYQDQDSVHFIHSAGQVIGFGISKQITEQYGGCDECCETGTYENAQILLEPNYPAFYVSIAIYGDSLNVERNLFIGNNAVNIPTTLADSSSLDSIYFNNRFYNNVLKLKFVNYSDNGTGLYADSLYYNGDSGMLKVIMSNQEYYQLYE